MIEEFKDIEGYEGLYQVSNLGNVKSLKFKKERILKGTVIDTGYLNVSLRKDGIRVVKKIHQLVAIAFLGHEPNGYKTVVDHINNNPLNNTLDNLQLITHRENLSKDKKGCSSDYTGVGWHKGAKKWHAQIYIKGKVKHLGLFTDELEAAESYIIELQKLYI
tara:strand:+ start:150 stop:635 length:486 start_codon:yes stop_codon:yes gene_type:complete